MPIIEVNHLTKRYQLGRQLTIKRTLVDMTDRLRGRDVPKPKLFEALHDVNFTINEGEVVGIIGHNGAGKSTLLKMLSRISTPTEGTVRIHGTVAPLIEVGAGLVGDMTGRENIFLNGAIMGVPKAVIKEKFDDIVAFAELEKFVDTPIKRYSSGMQIRLAFAVATSVDPDILIVDEVLAVGDLAFQRKCFDRMERLIKDQGKTVLLVSHNIRQVERLCTRVILMDHGQIVADGDPTEVCNLFYSQNNEKIKAGKTAFSKNQRIHHTGGGEVVRVALQNSSGESVESVEVFKSVRIQVEFDLHEHLDHMVVAASIHTTDFFYLAVFRQDPQVCPPGRYLYEVEIPEMLLLPGVYCISAGLWQGDAHAVIFHGETLLTFTVDPNPERPIYSAFDGIFAMPAERRLSGQAQPANVEAGWGENV